MQTRYVSLALALALFARAGAAAESTAGMLTVHADPSLTLSQVIDAAVDREPRSGIAAAVGQEAGAMRDRAGSILSGAPALSVLHHNDAPASANGVREWETGIELPLWRPGQRRASREVASRTQAVADSSRSALRYEVAGAVRQALWELAVADERVALAHRAWQTARALEADVRKRVRTGDLAQADLLLARDEALTKQDEYLSAAAELRQSESRYRTLTGLTVRPAQFAETRSRRSVIEPTHPLLTDARARVSRTRAELMHTERARGGSPQLIVGTRHEKTAVGADYETSLAIGFRIPFGTRTYNAPAVAAANTALAEADSRHQAQRRALELALSKAREQVQTLHAELALVREQHRLAQENLRMARIAFNVGEMDLTALLRVQARAFNAERNLSLRRVQLQHAVANYNQAVGVTP